MAIFTNTSTRGVSTVFESNTITLKKVSESYNPIKLDLINAPDIAQTIAVTALALGIECHMIGLHTLKIKETDRLVALKTEIEKLGGIQNHFPPHKKCLSNVPMICQIGQTANFPVFLKLEEPDE